MGAIDLSSTTRAQTSGSGTVDGTIANNKITLPGWVREVHLYLDDSGGAGTVSLGDSSSAVPLAGQAWQKVWAIQGSNPTQVKHLWVASNSGSQTLYYLLF